MSPTDRKNDQDRALIRYYHRAMRQPGKKTVGAGRGGRESRESKQASKEKRGKVVVCSIFTLSKIFGLDLMQICPLTLFRGLS